MEQNKIKLISKSAVTVVTDINYCKSGRLILLCFGKFGEGGS